MHPPQPPPNQPPLPLSVLPPLPPGPPPETQTSIPPPPLSNGSLEKGSFLPFAALPGNGIHLPYHNPFDFRFTGSPQPDAFYQGVQFFPPISLPPPMFPMARPNFSFPPPPVPQPHLPFEASLEVGIPFPPPGYDVNTHSSSHEICNSNHSRDSHALALSQRSRSPRSSCLRSSNMHSESNSRRRSRSRSYSKRRSRSRSQGRAHSRFDMHQSRSRSDRQISSRAQRSRSRSRGSRQSRSDFQKKRSVSRDRGSRRTRSRSRSHAHSKRRSRSASRGRRRSKSNSRNSGGSRSSSKRSWRSRSNSRVSRSSRSYSKIHNSSDYRPQVSHSPPKPSKLSRSERNLEKSISTKTAPDASGTPMDFGESSVPKENGQGTTPDDGSELITPKENGESSVAVTKEDILHFKENNILGQRERSKSERESLVERWRLNNCKNLEEVASKLDVLSKMEADEIIELEKQTWTRSAPADLYYKRSPQNPTLMEATPRLLELCEKFDSDLIQRAERERKNFPSSEPQPREATFKPCKHTAGKEDSSSSSSCDDSSSDEDDKAIVELERKKQHPQRLHSELWHNESGEMNDGPLCRCSHRARRSGIRHNVYVGEQKLEKCDVDTNNAGKLYHYRVTMSPPVNFLTKTPTIIEHDSHEYIFEGFSMLSHFPLVKLPTCKVIRFNIEYTILYVDEAMPENFTIRELDLFYNYLFHEILELLDLDLKAFEDPNGCNQFHFMPRFVRDLPENGKEILSMNEVLKYLLKSNKPLVPEDRLNEIYNMSLYDWQTFADEVKCMVVTKPGMKPCSLRVDQLDRETMDEGRFPEIVHFGIRPPQLSYAGNTEYQKHWREYVKFRHLLANMPKPSAEDKRKLMGKENRLQEMRSISKMKRDVTIALGSQGFYRTGIMCDIIQHALLLPVLVCHLRFHKSLDQLEEDMDYKFKNRYLLQLALTHPSYRENFGTNPDHARNSLTNCGIRQPEYGDRRIHYMNSRKRGINTLIQIMSRFGKKEATESNIGHNERLEFLGDAVVEFITSIHLFHLFPDLEEGGLATYRAAIVQNQHLAVMARRLHLDSYMLYAHGSDLCHDLELRHAMANCFEALMGALFLDGGIEVADKVFGLTLWKQEANLADVWMNYPLHPLQEQEPAGDRQWIEHFPVLQKLTEFETRTGIVFKHIRLLARSFTDRSVGYTNLTLGSNQRLEFLGDTVLQIIASEYLYKFFPEHHEGHLSLLRSSLVNNRTQAVVCDDLGMTEFALYANPKHDIKTKDRADLLEAFLGALYIDKGLKHCHLFCEVCFFPRLQDFIMNQDWNDPKSKLQQCCLTLRTMEGGEPDIPVYKVIQCMGPTNTRIYTVAVYFRGERLAQASGHSIQQAEMNAANEALELSTALFPQLDHQRRVIAKSMKKQKKRARREAALRAARELDRASEDKSRSKDRSHRHDRRDRRGHHQDDDRDRDRDRDKGRGRGGTRRDGSRDDHRDKDRVRDRDRTRSDKERDRDLDKDRGRDRDRDRERGRDRERDRVRGKDRDRGSGRDKAIESQDRECEDKDGDGHKEDDWDRVEERVRNKNTGGTKSSDRGRKNHSKCGGDNSKAIKEYLAIRKEKSASHNVEIESANSHSNWVQGLKPDEDELPQSPGSSEDLKYQQLDAASSKSHSSCNSSPSRMSSRSRGHSVSRSVGSDGSVCEDSGSENGFSSSEDSSEDDAKNEPVNSALVDSTSVEDKELIFSEENVFGETDACGNVEIVSEEDMKEG